MVGAAAIAAGWLYTGGPKPYGYYGFGELFVFVFFGLVATAGTTYVLVERLTGLSLVAGAGVGALACALLVVNNLRDIPTDASPASAPWPCASATAGPGGCSTSAWWRRPSSPRVACAAWWRAPAAAGARLPAAGRRARRAGPRRERSGRQLIAVLGANGPAAARLRGASFAVGLALGG